MTATPVARTILGLFAYGHDVYLVRKTDWSDGRHTIGKSRWIKKTAKFSSNWYVGEAVLKEGKPVPADHPAHAVVGRL